MNPRKFLALWAGRRPGVHTPPPGTDSQRRLPDPELPAPGLADPGLADPERAILAEQVRVVYLEGQRLILTGLAVGSILVWVLWDHVAHEVLVGWFGAFAIYSGVRLIMARAYRRRAARIVDHRAWMTGAQWALAVGGGFWASACFLLYVPDRIEYQLFLVALLLGAAVSGLVTLAVHLPAYLAFITPFVAAGVVRFGLENDPLHWGVALAAIAALFIFINFARYIQRNFVESLRLRMEVDERNRELAERNREVESANLAKSRFLAAASHDLRQPLHALNLFVAQLANETDEAERRRLVTRIDVAVAGMNELFGALLDISKLDAGVLAPSVADFPVDHCLRRVEATFAGVAREKGLRLGVVPCAATVRSDAILLERILFNLVSNAVRYTVRGGVVVGCRRRGSGLRIEVWDSGIGIPDDQHRTIFGEFRQLAPPGKEPSAGLGLGLAIVERLCRLLDHPIELSSRPGKGSRFAVTVPLVASRPAAPRPVVVSDAIADPARGRLIVVVDDDPLVLDGMRGLLQGWGCRVVIAPSVSAALAGLEDHGGRPDLIISDHRLADGKTGYDVVERLRTAFQARIPAFLITGDTTTERLREARALKDLLLHKPVNPKALRAAVNQLLRPSPSAARRSAADPSPAPTPQ
jgi:signal transduction histidine kinase/CheY-like chemotaxis protein